MIQSNYLTLLGGLRTLLPDTAIAMIGTYNPLGTATPDAALADQGIQALNGLIAGIAEAVGPGVSFVNIYDAFVGNELTYSYIAGGNIHPTPAGYAAIAREIPAAAVPEPSSAVLLAMGALAVGGLVVRRNRRAA